jgi:hypothetical protein
MNRKERRAAAARARQNRERHDRFFQNYVSHLPQVPLDAPLEPGRVYHLSLWHDPGCRFYETGKLADCACDLVITRHIEPGRT